MRTGCRFDGGGAPSDNCLPRRTNFVSDTYLPNHPPPPPETAFAALHINFYSRQPQRAAKSRQRLSFLSSLGRLARHARHARPKATPAGSIIHLPHFYGRPNHSIFYGYTASASLELKTSPRLCFPKIKGAERGFRDHKTASPIAVAASVPATTNPSSPTPSGDAVVPASTAAVVAFAADTLVGGAAARPAGGGSGRPPTAPAQRPGMRTGARTSMAALRSTRSAKDLLASSSTGKVRPKGGGANSAFSGGYSSQQILSGGRVYRRTFFQRKRNEHTFPSLYKGRTMGRRESWVGQCEVGADLSIPMSFSPRGWL